MYYAVTRLLYYIYILYMHGTLLYTYFIYNRDLANG